MERKNAWKGYDEAKSAKVDALAKDYMDFLDNGKTERGMCRYDCKSD